MNSTHKYLTEKKCSTISEGNEENSREAENSKIEDSFCGLNQMNNQRYDSEALMPRLNNFMKMSTFNSSIERKLTIDSSPSGHVELLKKEIQPSKFYRRNSAKNKTGLPLAEPRKSKNYLWITFFVKKFAEIIKWRSLVHKMKKLKKYHLELIDDKSSSTLDYKKFELVAQLNNPFQKLYEVDIGRFAKFVEYLKEKGIALANKVHGTVGHITRNIKAFEPDKLPRLICDFYLLFLLALNVFIFPMTLCFQLTKNHFNPVIWFFFETLPAISLIVFIFINLNTAYYSRGVFVSSKLKIIRHYFKQDFVLDVLSIFPYFLPDEAEYTPYFRWLFIIRLFKVRRLVRKIEEHLELKEYSEGLFRLCKLLYLSFFVAHVCGCLWNFTAEYEISNGEKTTWLHNKGIEDKHWMVRYVSALYWSTMTMITVGYGDITPQTTFEQVVSVLVMFVACGSFGYTLNTIGTIVDEMNKQDYEFKGKFKEVKHFLGERNINQTLQMRVKRYLEYMHEYKKSGYQTQDKVLSSLSGKLREEVLKESYGKFLRDSSLFGTHFSHDFLDTLGLYVKEITYAPDDTIFNASDRLVDRGIYFILKGEVEFMLKIGSSTKHLQVYKKGEFFGEQAFFTGRDREAIAISTQVTTVAYLPEEDFKAVCLNYQRDFEKFCMIRDTLNLYRNQAILHRHCPSCESNCHPFRDCPIIRYVPNRDIIIKKYQIKKRIERKPFQRSAQRKCVRILFNEDTIMKKIQPILDNTNNNQTLESLKSKIDDLKKERRFGVVNLLRLFDSRTRQAIENVNRQSVHDILRSVNEISSPSESESEVDHTTSPRSAWLVKREKPSPLKVDVPVFRHLSLGKEDLNARLIRLEKGRSSDQASDNLEYSQRQQEISRPHSPLLKKEDEPNFQRYPRTSITKMEQSPNFNEKMSPERKNDSTFSEATNEMIVREGNAVGLKIASVANKIAFIDDPVLSKLDKMKSFSSYFPHNNIETVMKRKAFIQLNSSVSPTRRKQNLKKMKKKKTFIEMIGMKTILNVKPSGRKKPPVVITTSKQIEKDKSASFTDLEDLNKFQRSKSISNSINPLDDSKDPSNIPKSALIKPKRRKSQRKSTFEQQLENIKALKEFNYPQGNFNESKFSDALKNHDIEFSTKTGNDEVLVIDHEETDYHQQLRKLKVITESPELSEQSPKKIRYPQVGYFKECAHYIPKRIASFLG